MNVVRYIPLLFTIIFFSNINSVTAQYYEPEIKTNKTEKNRLIDSFHFGGNLGAQLGPQTSLFLSPTAYYDVTDNVKIGSGLNYVYINHEYLDVNESYTIYGGRLLVSYDLLFNVMLSTDFEQDYVSYKGNSSSIDPYWLSSWYIGGGYYFPVGKNGRVIASMCYDVLYQKNKSYFSSPWRPTIGIYF